MTNNYNFKILIVDDEVEYQEVLKIILEEKGYNVEVASSGKEALKILHKESFNLVLTDLIMDNMNGMELLEEVKKQNLDIEVILVTGYGTIENAVDAMKKGAYSYFVKGHSPEELLLEIEKVKKLTKLKSDNEFYKKKEICSNALLESNSKRVNRILEICEKVARSNVNVLIIGESGVGKEVLAKYIHMCSDRKKERFVPVNCQALSENLLESELFGHEKGAFTGALEKRIGRFEEANGGTLFLDEIGEIPIGTQTKLLRAIETKSIERVGNNKNIKIDIKLICATNRNIHQEIERGKFRTDLFYRINTILLELPPLRERTEDLHMFIKFFIDKCSREMKKKINKIENGVIDFLLNYDYPGNIRELKNIIERLVVLSDRGIIKAKDLPDYNYGKKYCEQDNIKSLKDIRKEAELEYIKVVLNRCKGNLTNTAKYLDISRRQLYNKLVEYNLN
ncbi:sigma-54-dependent transcriptional regulator [Clostridiisalibacter paucivorans]|uniref:sigma-54-dependent transcriptional regulator n=1 Tax=Clostridiisalibacter paucivorans TaxID=408753 RepID=UPI00047CC81C|nr:sigma-54 dependent transcriptional regulator [Clostridiisalibacter paucivorans]